MAEPIGPGDWVECIDDSPGVIPAACGLLVLGALYQVDEVGEDEDDSGMLHDAVTLTYPKHFMPEGWEASFKASRFRPIRDGQERIVKPDKVTAHDC